LFASVANSVEAFTLSNCFHAAAGYLYTVLGVFLHLSRSLHFCMSDEPKPAGKKEADPNIAESAEFLRLKSL